MSLTRQQALDLVHEYTASEALRRHMLAVELAMRAMAGRAGEDADAWGLVGLLHDFDYERFPNDSHSATDEHPSEGVRILAARGNCTEAEETFRHALASVPAANAQARASLEEAAKEPCTQSLASR